MKSIAEIFRSYGVLNADGKHVNGTDKMTNHFYGDAYESILPDRHVVCLMMEIGVADGSSLLAWRDIFPFATIVGLDIHHSDKAHGERIEFHLGDMGLLKDCKRAAAGRMFDVIVEDATHYLIDTLRTLLFLWPNVKPGGLYVVEEFQDIGSLRANIPALWPFAEVVDTQGPFGGNEPLVVFRKPK